VALGGTAAAAPAYTASPASTANSPASQTPTTASLDDKTGLGTYLDNFFTGQMAQYHFTGATLSIVKDGQLFFSKGYGSTNTAGTTPVSPAQTVFRVGSISKLFVATALMQLAEQGKIRLADPVNRYLPDFKLDERFGLPITIGNLLTHTAGFEEREIGITTLDKAARQPLGEYLKQHLPALVEPPGGQESYAYSNYGYALAGYIVETVSGKSFDLYVRENILQPLDMRYSSFTLTPELEALRATGYRYTFDNLEAIPYDYQQIYPAGALNSTADDIAHFMQAQLGDGRYNNAQVLQPASLQEMQTRQYGHHPALNGITFGFDEYYQNGLRTLYHEGNWPGFASLLLLIPEKKVGIFVSYNRDINIPREKLVQQFIDRFYPAAAPAQPIKSIASNQNEVEKFAGVYRSSRYNRTTLEKLFSLTVQGKVVADPDGTLTIPTDSPFYQASHWVETEPQLFKLKDGNDFSSQYLYFEQDNRGNVTHMFVGLNDWQKLDWYEQSVFQVWLAGIMGLVFTVGPLTWAATRLRKGSSGAENYKAPLASLSQFFRRISLIYCVLTLSFLSGLGIVIVLFRNDFIYGLPLVMDPLLCLPIFTTILTPVLVGGAALAWLKRYWSGWFRLYFSLLTVTSVVYVAFLLYWNLLGFNF
jgi:CubicO group peptidase (beta-lactamase class C family)